jgi:CheY-like chemotaxis protein
MKMQPVLYAEDDSITRISLVMALEAADFQIREAATGEDAIRALEAEAFVALVTDVNLGPGPDGWEVARRARELSPGLPVVYVSAEAGEQWAAYGVPHSVMVAKPFVPAQVVVALSTLLNAASDLPTPSQNGPPGSPRGDGDAAP